MPFVPHPMDPRVDLEFVRDVPLPPEQIWAAWTTPGLVEQWFTPKPWETTHCEIDLRPGGRFRTIMRSPDGEESDGTGCYLEVLPGERLVWTSALTADWRPQSGPMPFTAVIELQPNGDGGTRYRVVAMHQNPEDAAQHEAMGFSRGWGAALDQLVELMHRNPGDRS